MPRKQTAGPSEEKQLSIKTGVVKRLVKEVSHYKSETIENEERVERMKADETKDKYDVKKAEEVLEETRMMIPDSTRRLNLALDELEMLVDTQNPQVLESADYLVAKRFIAERSELQ